MNFATLDNMGEKYCIIVHITKKGDQEEVENEKNRKKELCHWSCNFASFSRSTIDDKKYSRRKRSRYQWY